MERRFVEFQIATKLEEGEYSPEGTSRGFVDVNTIESFYEVEDGIILEMESGNGFKVRDNLDFVSSVINA